MMMNIAAQPGTVPSADPVDVGTVCHGWWKTSLNKNSGAGRTARAKLRRASTPVDTLSVAEVHDLYAALGRGIAPDRLSLIAVALAQLEDNDVATAAELFGRKHGKNNRTLSELRFQNLIRITDPVALIVPLRRALAIIDKRAAVRRLAGDLYYWGEKVRTRWCFDYYGAGTASPKLTKDEEPQT